MHTTYSGHETNRMDNPGKRAQDTNRRQKKYMQKSKKMAKTGCTQIFANVFQFLSDHKIPIVLLIAKYGKNLACDVGMKKIIDVNKEIYIHLNLRNGYLVTVNQFVMTTTECL